MERLGVPDFGSITVLLDVNQPSSTGGVVGVFRTGSITAAINGETPGPVVRRGWELEGQMWTEGNLVTGRFTKLFVPPGTKDTNGDPLPRVVPVCLQLGDRDEYGLEKLEGSKPGAVRLMKINAGHFTWEWNQP
jgi:hypothetical protein